MVSFVTYVLRFSNDDSALGDVARDMIEDSDINRRWGFRSLMRYLETNHNCCDSVLGILTDANTAYIVNRRGY